MSFMLIFLVFLGLFLLTDYCFKTYEFNNGVLNCLIVLNAVVSNPFNMLVTCLVVDWYMLTAGYFLKLLLFFGCMALCTFVKFIFWNFLRRNKKFKLHLLLDFSKRYVFHSFIILYLPILCMDNFSSLNGNIFTALVLQMLFGIILLCAFYMFISNKYILKANFLKIGSKAGT